MATLFLFKDHFLNLRYVSSLYIPFYLISGLGFWHILSFVPKKMDPFSSSLMATFIMAALVFAAVIDYKNFERISLELFSSFKMIEHFICYIISRIGIKKKYIPAFIKNKFHSFFFCNRFNSIIYTSFHRCK